MLNLGSPKFLQEEGRERRGRPQFWERASPASPQNFLKSDTSSTNNDTFSPGCGTNLRTHRHSSPPPSHLSLIIPSFLPFFISTTTSTHYNHRIDIEKSFPNNMNMNITMKGHACMLAFAFLLFVCQVQAFQIPVQPKTCCSTSLRHPSTTALGVAEKKPRWTELPRSRENRRELSGFEINTGRLAMVGFCGLLATEIVSGQSFGEQFLHAISSATVVNLPI